MARQEQLMRSVTRWAAVALLGASGATSQAATYTGTWDPAYGSQFPNLGWKGSATFFIPDACLALSGWISNANGCSSGAMDVVSATLSFYNSTTNPTGTGAPIESFALNPNALVYKMFVSAGELTGVSSDYFDPVAPVTAGGKAIAGNGDYYFHLKFLEQVSPEGTPSVQLFNTFGFEDPTCLLINTCRGGGAGTQAILRIQPQFAQVPEPSNYALMAAGLAALGWSARRRRQVA